MVAAPLWSYVLFIGLDAAIVVLACAVVYISTRRTYGWTRTRGIPLWVGVSAAIAVEGFMFLGGWIFVVAWWIVRLPIRWLPQLHRSAISN